MRRGIVLGLIFGAGVLSMTVAAYQGPRPEGLLQQIAADYSADPVPRDLS